MQIEKSIDGVLGIWTQATGLRAQTKPRSSGITSTCANKERTISLWAIWQNFEFQISSSQWQSSLSLSLFPQLEGNQESLMPTSRTGPGTKSPISETTQISGTKFDDMIEGDFYGRRNVWRWGAILADGYISKNLWLSGSSVHCLLSCDPRFESRVHQMCMFRFFQD